MYSISNSHFLRAHRLVFDGSLQEERDSKTELVSEEMIKEVKVVNFSPIHMLLDASGRFLSMVDPRGNLKIYLTSSFKQVREFKFGFGPASVRLRKHLIFCLTKDRVLTAYDLLAGKKFKQANLKKYKNVDTPFHEFVVLDDKMRYVAFGIFQSI